MEENKTKTEEQKPTVTIELAEYEKLRAENVRMRQAYQNLMVEANNMHDALVEKRVVLLFKVVENSVRFDNEFVDYCISQIRDSLIIPAMEEKENNDGK